MRSIRNILTLSLVSVALAACQFDPRIFFVPGALINSLRDQDCMSNPMYTYITGAQCPEMEKSPVSRWNANDSNAGGYCLLSQSVLYGNLPAFIDLIGHGADPKKCKEYPDIFYRSLMSIHTNKSCQATSEEFLPEFYKNQIYPPPITPVSNQNLPKYGVNIFGYAILNGCTDLVKLYISRGVKATEPVSSNYQYPLHFVKLDMDSGLDILDVLIKNGANPNTTFFLIRNTETETFYESAKRRYGKTPRWSKIEAIIHGK